MDVNYESLKRRLIEYEKYTDISEAKRKMKLEKGKIECELENSKKNNRINKIRLGSFNICTVLHLSIAITHFSNKNNASGLLSTAASMCFGANSLVNIIMIKKENKRIENWNRCLELVDDEIRKLK